MADAGAFDHVSNDTLSSMDWDGIAQHPLFHILTDMGEINESVKPLPKEKAKIKCIMDKARAGYYGSELSDYLVSVHTEACKYGSLLFEPIWAHTTQMGRISHKPITMPLRFSPPPSRLFFLPPSSQARIDYCDKMKTTGSRHYLQWWCTDCDEK